MNSEDFPIYYRHIYMWRHTMMRLLNLTVGPYSLEKIFVKMPGAGASVTEGL